MCQHCNHLEWAKLGLTPMAYQAQLPPDRLQACLDAYAAITAAAHDPDSWQGGSLHVQVDDDNYDNRWDGIWLWWGEQWMTPERRAEDMAPGMPTLTDEIRAGQAWNGLRFYERALVVAWVNRYWTDVHPPSAEPVAT